MKPQRTQKSQSDPEKGEQAGSISIPDFNLHYAPKRTTRCVELYRKQAQIPESPEVNLQFHGNQFTRNELRTYTQERTVPSINHAGKNGRHTPRNNSGHHSIPQTKTD